MNFGSDNMAGVSPRIMAALAEANAGPAPAYGNDDLTRRAESVLQEFFEHEVAVAFVSTGTAANALALSCLVEPFGAVVCHAEAHIMVDECGAPEFYSGGAKLVGSAGYGAKLTPEIIVDVLERVGPLKPHHVRPQAVSVTQASEIGTVYSQSEIAAISVLAHARGLKVHMDGARFANALTHLDCAPADITWRAGVDVLCFGATKAGAMAAEAVIAFDPTLREALAYRRKRSGHLLSKHRFIAAQWISFLEKDHWRELAGHANAMAQRLAAGIAASGRGRVAFAVEANEVFAVIARADDERLRAAGAIHHPWSTHGIGLDPLPGDDEVFVRLVTSFATTERDVDRFLAVLGGKSA